MKTLIATLFILGSYTSLAQDTISAQLVNQFTSSFVLEEGQLQGDGADMLLNEFHASQFVLLGETHEDAQIAVFTKAIIPCLGREGYRHFITENGNHELQEMLRSIQHYSTTVENLHTFYSQEYRRVEEQALPFFSGNEDALFLQEALKQGVHLFGIDQTYFYAYPLLFDQLLLLSEGGEKITLAHQKAMQFILEEYRLEKEKTGYPFPTRLLKAAEINSFFELLDLENKSIASIIEAIRESWKIYALNASDRSKSFQVRGEWMKQQFDHYLTRLQNDGLEMPKMLFKLGAMHTMRGETPLGIKDIGAHVHELANENDVRDLNLTFMFRYYLDEDESLGYFDNSEGNSTWLNERKAFMLQGRVEEWRIIALKKLQEYLNQNSIYVHSPLQKMMDRHDYIIIPPATKDVQRNYSTSLH